MKREPRVVISWGQREGGPGSEGLVAGVVAALIAWAGMLVWLAMRKHQGTGFSIFYNMPISVAFIGLCAHEMWMCRELGVRRYVREHAPVMAVWCAGLVVLYLRLITKSVDVSGHMTWALVMMAQCYCYRLPGWFCMLVGAVFLQVLGLKLFLLGGWSGYWGMLVGGILGGFMWAGQKVIGGKVRDK